MTDITIRKSEPDDLEQIIAMEQACFPPEQAASAAALKERLHAFGPFFIVAEKGGTLIGMINGMTTDEEDLRDEMYEDTSLQDPDGKNIMIFGVDTLPACQSQGVASQIMRAFIRQAQTCQKNSIVLTCLDRLIGFYERFGFICEGQSASLHGNVVWYQMRLNLK